MRSGNLFLLLRGGGVPEGGGGSEKPLVLLIDIGCCRYHPGRWPPLLPGGGEFGYHPRLKD